MSALPGSEWAQWEVELLVLDYLEMLGKELGVDQYVKSEHRRRLEAALPGRSKGSIERKHQNVSAVLSEMGLSFIQGYKPLANYQGLVKQVVVRSLVSRGAASLVR